MLMIREAPRIETERLILRPWRKQDFAPYYAIVSDPEVMRHFSGPAMSKEDGWRRLAASVGSWPLLGFGGWAVARRSDERLIGMVSLFNAWRALGCQACGESLQHAPLRRLLGRRRTQTPGLGFVGLSHPHLYGPLSSRPRQCG